MVPILQELKRMAKFMLPICSSRWVFGSGAGVIPAL